MKDVMMLIEDYIEKYPLAAEMGSEFISQDDEAQEDALQLVYDIFDAIIP